MTTPHHPRHPDRVGSPTRPRNGRTIRRTPDPALRLSGPLPLVGGGQGRSSRELRRSGEVASDAATALAGFALGGLAALILGAVAVGVARLLWAVVTVWAAVTSTGGAS